MTNVYDVIKLSSRPVEWIRNAHPNVRTRITGHLILNKKLKSEKTSRRDKKSPGLKSVDSSAIRRYLTARPGERAKASHLAHGIGKIVPERAQIVAVGGHLGVRRTPTG